MCDLSLRPNGNTRGRPTGFTLVDVTVTVLIMGILAGVAMPAFARLLDDYRVEAAARELAGNLNYVARAASHRSQEITVTIDPATSQWSVPALPHPNHPGQPWNVELSSSGFPATLISVGFGGDSEVTFDVNALPDSGGTVVLTAGGATRTVVLSPVDGRAVMQ